MRASLFVASVAAAATVTGFAVAGASADRAAPRPGAARTAPDPAQFDDPQQNPYFPVRPGTVLRYRGSEDDERFRERVVVTHRTKTIQGVTTTVVRDVVRRSDGSVEERTRDWYAPDDDGNVWYFGEDTATYRRNGSVESREGSWQAGVDGAVAGTIMPADPGPTDAYRQEYYRGHATDQAWIVQRNDTTTVPLRTFHHVVRSFEWTRLEPRVVSQKLYARGVGIVREGDKSGGDESFVLVDVQRP